MKENWGKTKTVGYELTEGSGRTIRKEIGVRLEVEVTRSMEYASEEKEGMRGYVDLSKIVAHGRGHTKPRESLHTNRVNVQ